MGGAIATLQCVILEGSWPVTQLSPCGKCPTQITAVQSAPCARSSSSDLFAGLTAIQALERLRTGQKLKKRGGDNQGDSKTAEHFTVGQGPVEYGQGSWPMKIDLRATSGKDFWR